MQKLEDRDYFSDFEIAKDPYPFFEATHGPTSARTFDFEPSFIIRDLSALHVRMAAA